MERYKQPAGTAVYHEISLSQNNGPRLSDEGWETQRRGSGVAELDLTSKPQTQRTRWPDESCQSAFAAFLLPQAGGVSPPLIPPGTHRWKLLMVSLCGWAWLGYDSRPPVGGAARRSAERFWLGKDSFEGVTSSRSRQRVEDSEGSGSASLCTTDTCQCRAQVSWGGFQEATKLFGSGEKHVNMDQSGSSSSYLGLASMSRWNQMTQNKKERREKRRKHI